MAQSAVWYAARRTPLLLLHWSTGCLVRTGVFRSHSSLVYLYSFMKIFLQQECDRILAASFTVEGEGAVALSQTNGNPSRFVLATGKTLGGQPAET